jgi:predicted XRE-type DNA-binding protein
MRNANKDNKPSHITKGDIFDDLGFSPADTLEAKIKADIWQALVQHIEKREFSQTYLVDTLEVHQPDVSNLLRGKISKISITKLIQFAAKLNLNARIKVTAPKAITERSASSAKAGNRKRSLTLA